MAVVTLEIHQPWGSTERCFKCENFQLQFEITRIRRRCSLSSVLDAPENDEKKWKNEINEMSQTASM